MSAVVPHYHELEQWNEGVIHKKRCAGCIFFTRL